MHVNVCTLKKRERETKIQTEIVKLHRERPGDCRHTSRGDVTSNENGGLGPGGFGGDTVP